MKQEAGLALVVLAADLLFLGLLPPHINAHVSETHMYSLSHAAEYRAHTHTHTQSLLLCRSCRRDHCHTGHADCLCTTLPSL